MALPAAPRSRDVSNHHCDCLHSLALTPVLISAQPLLPRSRLENIVQRSETIVIAGLGPVGNAVVEALRHAGQPLMLVDRNPKLFETWQDEKDIMLHEGRIEDMEDWLPVLGKRPRAVILTFPIPDTSAVVAKTCDGSMLITVIARSPYIRGIDTPRLPALAIFSATNRPPQ